MIVVERSTPGPLAEAVRFPVRFDPVPELAPELVVLDDDGAGELEIPAQQVDTELGALHAHAGRILQQPTHRPGQPVRVHRAGRAIAHSASGPPAHNRPPDVERRGQGRQVLVAQRHRRGSVGIARGDRVDELAFQQVHRDRVLDEPRLPELPADLAVGEICFEQASAFTLVNYSTHEVTTLWNHFTLQVFGLDIYYMLEVT
ncbi:hypothetical protein IQ251_18400 [Saccharopolyspora sp. HNM0983]|uniref:Uncharacterized protein n=1 Tax=Saccharopolyspora montiporae TaxID=2781240 RepID=A0A929BAR5_9PSEU|nr:hypothetical protein [Saccharopolyspora sp. HNM0983]